MSLSVLVLTRYARLGASSRVRFYNYFDLLERAGIALTPAPFFADDYLSALYAGAPVWQPTLRAYFRRLLPLVSAHQYNLLWIEKELFPFAPDWLERLAVGAIPYVVDFDDAWFLRYRQHGSAAARRLLGGKFERLVRHANLTVVGNDYLAGWARESGAANVLLLPTVVDLVHYPVRPAPKTPFTVGWIGTPSTISYLYAIAEPLRHFCAEGNARLLVIGADPVRIDGVETETLPWAEQTEAELLSRCHVGVMPLSDDPWSLGKCAYKLIQYMAVGRPVVASRVGTNRAIVRHGENGFLATTTEEWLDALRRLRDDAGLRLEFGAAGRRLIESKYCVEKTSDTLARALYVTARRAL